MEDVKSRLDEITQEIMEIKKSLIGKPLDKQKTKQAWLDMQKAGKEISRKWKGANAAEEIRHQRSK